MEPYTHVIDLDGEYMPSPIVLERTNEIARSREYECGYWIQSFIRFYNPGVYFRAISAFGDIQNYMELRYLMEHATFDPAHPLYHLDYETCSADDRRRLDVFREIAWSCCYCWYAIVKRDRPNLLPIRERKPLTKKEEKYLRWMGAYYANTRTHQERAAFRSLIFGKFKEVYPPLTPTQEEIEAFNTYQTVISGNIKRELRQEALCREAERLKKLPPKVFITSHDFIKRQFRQVFGSDNQVVAIRHQFELGDLAYRGKLPATKELVVLLNNDIRSHLLLRYIAAHFHGEISVIDIVGKETEWSPSSLNNDELRESCSRQTKLSNERIKELRKEFEMFKASSSEFYCLQDTTIRSLSACEVDRYIINQFSDVENFLFDILVNCLVYKPKGWPPFDSFYLYNILCMCDDDIITLTNDNKPFDVEFFPINWHKEKNRWRVTLSNNNFHK